MKHLEKDSKDHFDFFLHDLTNYIQPALQALEVIREGTEPELEEKLLRTAHRSVVSMQSLCTLSRFFREGEPIKTKAVNAAILNRKVKDFLEDILPTTISLVLEGDEPSGQVRVNNALWKDIVMNLAINSSEAMNGKGRLFLHQEQGEGTFDEMCVCCRKKLKLEGRVSFITLRDEGRGMDEDSLAKFLEAHGSSKKEQGGHGLGLSSVIYCLRAMGGHLMVQSEPDEGSAFTLVLPLLEDAVEEIFPSPIQDTKARQHLRIAILEDHPDLGESLLWVCLEKGLEAQVYDDVQDLLVDLHEGLVDLVFSDLSLLGDDPIGWVKKWKKAKPGLKMSFSSGALLPEGLNAPFLKKPFSRDEFTSFLMSQFEVDS